MRKLLIYAAACAALVDFGPGCRSAQAGSVAFGQGSWQPAIVFRQLFDCLYNQAQGGGGGAVGIPRPGAWPKAKSCVSFNDSNLGGEILYEGNGFSNYRSNFLFGGIGDSSDVFDDRFYSFFELLFGVVTYTDTSLGISSVAQYDKLQFIAGESPVDAAEVAAWNKNGNPAKFGNIVQFPVAASPVALAFAGTDGNGHPLNILQPTPAGGSSGLNLSRNALCGIYSGHITKWNNPILTALNGGVLGSGQITVVVSDGAPNFLFTSSLASQCQFEIGPNNESDQTLVSYAFPWTDREGACPHPVARGSFKTNWPAFRTNDQCNTPNPVPTGSHFWGARWISEIVVALAYPLPPGTSGPLINFRGAIGLVPLEYINDPTLITASPLVHGDKLMAINIESNWDVTAGTGQFQPPTWQGARLAMSQATPQFDSTTRLNPLAWSLQGLVPDPVVQGAYPISGFTWVQMYQCYAPHASGNNPFIWFRNFLDYLYSSDEARNILHENGFAEVSPAWIVEIYRLATDPQYGPTQSGLGGCANIPGAL